MGFNLTNEYIDQSYQQLTQISGSQLVDGTGSLISDLSITASNALTASFLLGSIQSASYASFALTASYAINSVPQVSASYALSSSHADFAESAATASTANNANQAELIEVSTASNNNFYRVMFASSNGFQPAHIDSQTLNFYYNPSTNRLAGLSDITANNFYGNASTATVASTALSANTATFATSATSASYAVSSTLALSASHANIADLALVADLATQATNSTYSDNTIVYGKNLSGSPIAKGTPLYFTGSGTSGNLVGVYPADAGNPARMPAAGIAGETLTSPGGEGVVILDGFINGVDTSGFQSGQAVYVAVGGGYTNQRPTGSSNQVQSLGYVEKSAVNGSGVIKGSGRANDIPNLQQGHFFVGGAGDIGTTVSSGSFAKKAENNVFTGTQTFDNIAVNGTGSFAYIQSITGSAKVIGDAFIILNADSPAERYAGIKVYDSGSLQTGSLLYDSVDDHWEYVSTTEGYAAGLISGPTGSIGGTTNWPTQNTIVKGLGSNHIGDSSITDSGTLVTVSNPLTVTGQISGNLTGNVTGNADTATTANSLAAGNQTIDGNLGVSGSLYVSGVDQDWLQLNGPTVNNGVFQQILTPGPNTDFRGVEYNPSIALTKNNGTFDRQAGAFSISHNNPSLGDSYWNYLNVGAWGTVMSLRPSGSDHSSFFNMLVTGPSPYSTTAVTLAGDTMNLGSEGYTGTLNLGGNGTSINLGNNSSTSPVTVWGPVTQGNIDTQDVSVNANTASIDMTVGQYFIIEMDTNNSIVTLPNLTVGQTINIVVQQETTTGGGTLTFDPAFRFPGGTAPTITATAGAIDLISCIGINPSSGDCLLCNYTQNI